MCVFMCMCVCMCVCKSAWVCVYVCTYGDPEDLIGWLFGFLFRRLWVFGFSVSDAIVFLLLTPFYSLVSSLSVKEAKNY